VKKSPFASPEELARMLNVPVRTIYAWRTKGQGPPGYKIGKHIRFRLEDIDSWLEGQADSRARA
jgi:excisionase family DNA binding protein